MKAEKTKAVRRCFGGSEEVPGILFVFSGLSAAVSRFSCSAGWKLPPRPALKSPSPGYRKQGSLWDCTHPHLLGETMTIDPGFCKGESELPCSSRTCSPMVMLSKSEYLWTLYSLDSGLHNRKNSGRDATSKNHLLRLNGFGFPLKTHHCCLCAC